MSFGYFLVRPGRSGEEEIDGFLAALERTLHTVGYVS
jgi:hypothetical protein